MVGEICVGLTVGRLPSHPLESLLLHLGKMEESSGVYRWAEWLNDEPRGEIDVIRVQSRRLWESQV